MSSILQKFVTMTKILSPILPNHSPALSSLSSSLFTPILPDHSFALFYLRGKEFDSFLTKVQNYKIEIKKLMRSFSTASMSLLNHKLKWELLKYELCHIILPKLSEDKAKLCEEDLTKKHISEKHSKQLISR